MNSALPPMGWNSWDAYGTNVREHEILANAETMAERLLPFGYDTVVVDHQWYDPLATPGPYVGDWNAFPMDAYGRLLPDQPLARAPLAPHACIAFNHAGALKE